uniref:FH2 domain-containing protein n=1 Tax=Syphacia muris TaxID=451379 RepID=A0A0N5AZX8_9BILA
MKKLHSRDQKHDIFGSFKRELDEQIQLWYSDKVQNCSVHNQGRSSSIAESEGTNSSMESDEEQAIVDVPAPDQGKEKTVEEIVQLLKSVLNQKDDVIQSEIIRDICTAVLDKHTAVGLIKLIRQHFNIAADSPTVNVATPLLIVKPKSTPPPPPPLAPVAPTITAPAQESSTDLQKKRDLPVTLKPKVLPKKGIKLRQIQWTKLPADKVFSEAFAFDNIFMVASELSDNADESIDLNELEEKFSLPLSAEESTPEKNSAKKAEPLNLLSNKRSFNINIFLKQFKEGANQLLNCLRNGNCDGLQFENLNAFLNILPEKEEADLLRGFDGEVSQLDPAETFLLSLIDIPSYQLKLECLILREELKDFKKNLESNIDLLITACQEIQSSKMLPKVFCILVKIGNFLNAYGSSGNAAGFRLNSLWKVVDVKASKASLTILHFVELQDPSTVAALIQEFKHISDAAKLSFDNIKSEFTTMSERVEKQIKQINEAEEPAYFESFLNKLYTTEEEFSDLENKIKYLANTSKNLANYFCENEKTFKLDECLIILDKQLRQKHQVLFQENKVRQKREKIRSRRSSKISLGPTKPDEAFFTPGKQPRKVLPSAEKVLPDLPSTAKPPDEEIEVTEGQGVEQPSDKSRLSIKSTGELATIVQNCI